MDDCDIEPTPNDPEFDPYECESTYALWAFKEEGEPVKFLEASLVESPKISALPVREVLFFTGSRFERGRTIS